MRLKYRPFIADVNTSTVWKSMGHECLRKFASWPLNFSDSYHSLFHLKSLLQTRATRFIITMYRSSQHAIPRWRPSVPRKSGDLKQHLMGRKWDPKWRCSLFKMDTLNVEVVENWPLISKNVDDARWQKSDPFSTFLLTRMRSSIIWKWPPRGY